MVVEHQDHVNLVHRSAIGHHHGTRLSSEFYEAAGSLEPFSRRHCQRDRKLLRRVCYLSRSLLDFSSRGGSNLKHTFDPAHHERIIRLDYQSAEHLFTRDDHHATLNHQPLHDIEHPLFRRDRVTRHRKPSIQASVISAPARPVQLMPLDKLR
jgi:hypothetical protein